MRVLPVAILLLVAPVLGGCISLIDTQGNCDEGQQEVSFLDVPFWTCAPDDWRPSITQEGGRRLVGPGPDKVVIIVRPGELPDASRPIGEFKPALEAQLKGFVLVDNVTWTDTVWAAQPAISTIVSGPSTQSMDELTVRFISTNVGKWNFSLTTTIYSGPESAGLVAEQLLLSRTQFAAP